MQNFPTADREPVALWGIGLYAQDEWRMSKSLKLTFALRAEHDSNPVCQTELRFAHDRKLHVGKHRSIYSV